MLEAGDLRYEPATLRAWRGETELELSTTERLLLETFLRHPGSCSIATSCSSTSGAPDTSRARTSLDVYVRYLREKIDRPFGVTSIETVRGTGYRLRA